MLLHGATQHVTRQNGRERTGRMGQREREREIIGVNGREREHGLYRGGEFGWMRHGGEGRND